MMQLKNYDEIKIGGIMEDNFNEDYPCKDCSTKDWCDGWEAQFCCALCYYNGREDCDNCDPMDI